MRKDREPGCGWCVCCGESVGSRAAGALYCWSCCKLLQRATTRMGRVVKQAISDGLLKPLVGLVCVDCGDPAKYYDHRDILSPLAVEAVCHGCNVRRGPPSRLNKKLLETYLAVPFGYKPKGRPKTRVRKKPLTIRQLGLKPQRFNAFSHKHKMVQIAKRTYENQHGLRSRDSKDVGGYFPAKVRNSSERTRC